MATKEEVRGVILNGPNRWSLVIDGLVNGKPVEFEVDAGDAPFKIQVNVDALMRVLEVVSPDNELWSIEAYILPKNVREYKAISLQTGLEFVFGNAIKFYAKSYSTKDRDGRFIITSKDY
ncbi:MAG: hypothetical protein NT116_02925, partial [Candidatus Parcubacteria bacterium]|nr:hypothetical protein [Candidatus Parcubacteria bacterium]